MFTTAALATVAACSQPDATNDAAANNVLAVDGDVLDNVAANVSANGSETSTPMGGLSEGSTAAPGEAAPAAPPPAAAAPPPPPRPSTATKATPAPRPAERNQAATRPAARPAPAPTPTPTPTPTSNSTCTPEHEAMGHCKQ